MKKAIRMGVSALALVAAGPVFAADIYHNDGGQSLKDGPVFVSNWNGLYFGGHLGGAWGDVGFHDYYTNDGTYAKGSFSTGSVTGGGQLGYNFQRGALLFGIEADAGHLAISGSKNADGYSIYESSSSLYGDVTARLGLASDRALFYAKGGVAFLNAEFTNLYSNNGFASANVSSEDHTLVGWTIGGGVEYRLDANWSVKAEYQHFDFGDVTIQYSGIDDEKINFSAKADAVTAGVNYRFGRDEAPLK